MGEDLLQDFQNETLREAYEARFLEIEEIKTEIILPTDIDIQLVPGREIWLFFFLQEESFIDIEIESEIDPVMILFQIFSNGLSFAEKAFSNNQSETNLNPHINQTLKGGTYLLIITGEDYTQEGIITVIANEIF